ncbi:response regulator transcription factor [Candidatus Nitronereus thalassa]|uniref:Response regulator transcription factor n=1 Tax=Candidatus Nitronereus thalassa TaxID=3020898 RepID=A0ABU3KB57_9BACT|nr:response regulator transcription factor [Candidatus Nitronereus thalassa]MDT7043715.1 response regulator transcription factor [Candidatus Nitronereus thalassa]
MPPPRIVLADDHVLVAEGIQQLLASEFDLVGLVGDGRALLDMIQELQPDIALVDISLPLLNGFDAVRQVKKISPNIKIVFLTMHDDKTFVEEAFRVGACGYILKESAISELVFALHEITAGRNYVTPSLAQEPATQAGKASSPQHGLSPDSLTQRQREILQLVAEGRSNKEISQILSIALKTVEFHKTRLMRCLHVQTTAELTKYAIAHGLVTL